MHATKNHKSSYDKIINILYIEEDDEKAEKQKNHYVYIKNLDGLLRT